jgi:hypothetical protein
MAGGLWIDDRFLMILKPDSTGRWRVDAPAWRPATTRGCGGRSRRFRGNVFNHRRRQLPKSLHRFRQLGRVAGGEGNGGVRTDLEAEIGVLAGERAHRIGWQQRGSGDGRQRPTVGALESGLAGGTQLDGEALLVDGAVVAPA